MDTSLNAQLFVTTYLKEAKRSNINEISHGYSQAFASSGVDGVAQMIAHFSTVLTGGKLEQAAIGQLYAEFYAVLNLYFKDFRSIKLAPSR